MKKKAMKKSIIARGKRAKSSVYRGTKVRTSGGLKKDALIKSKSGRVVSKKMSLRGKVIYKTNGIAKWNAAVMRARKDLGIVGWCNVGGNTPKGKELLAKTRYYHKK